MKKNFQKNDASFSIKFNLISAKLNLKSTIISVLIGVQDLNKEIYDHFFLAGFGAGGSLAPPIFTISISSSVSCGNLREERNIEG